MLKAAFHDSTYTVRTRQLGFRDVDGMGVRGTESYNNPTLPGRGTGKGDGNGNGNGSRPSRVGTIKIDGIAM